MNAKGDKNRSVRSTKRNLQKAMVKLLKDKTIERITVRELTELADMNRATFYLHYKDTYDLLEQMEQSAIMEMQEFLTSDALQNFSKDGYSMLEQVFFYLYENQDRFIVLFGPNGRREAKRKVIDLNTEFFLKVLSEDQGYARTAMMEMGARFLLAGAFEVLEQQILRGCFLDNKELIQFYSYVTKQVFVSTQENLIKK